MKTLHWNGEHWHVNRDSLWKRVRKWLVWFGGWESYDPVEGRHGWQFRHRTGAHAWWAHPTPLSLLGHRFTLFKTGPTWWFQMALPRKCGGLLVVTLGKEGHAYISRDGTPNQAHAWLWGFDRPKMHSVPWEAREASQLADEHAAQREEERKARAERYAPAL